MKRMIEPGRLMAKLYPVVARASRPWEEGEFVARMRSTGMACPLLETHKSG